MEERWYAAIDLKSFYASVECVERGLDPLDTLLVVADRSRTEKTICLAVSPALKAHGIPGRARLFEVEEGMRRINTLRRMDAPRRRLLGSSTFAHELDARQGSCVIVLITLEYLFDDDKAFPVVVLKTVCPFRLYQRHEV